MQTARDQFETDKREILSILSDHKKSALRQKASVQWNTVNASIQSYLSAAGEDGWRSAFIPRFQGVITDQGERWNTEFGMQFDVRNLYSLEWFDQYTLKFAQDITNTTKTELSALMQQAEFEGWSYAETEKRIGQMFSEWQKGSSGTDWQWYEDRKPNYRVETIARTETMRASNAGGYQLFKAWGQTSKEWLATGDDRTRKSHLDAWIRYSRGGNPGPIPMDNLFEVGATRLKFPGDPAGDPDETINCRCTMLPGDVGGLNSLQGPGSFSSPFMATLWMQQQYPWVTYDFQDIPIGMVNDSLKAWRDLAADYPHIANNIQMLVSSSSSLVNFVGEPSEGWYALAAKKEKAIILNADWYQKMEQAQTPSSGGWTIHDHTFGETNMAHEFGHHVDFWLQGQTGKYYLPVISNDGIGAVDSSWRFFQRYNRMEYEFSQYGNTNRTEGMAESFVAMRYLPESEWSTHVKRFSDLLKISTPDQFLDEGKLIRQIMDEDEKAAAAKAILDFTKRYHLSGKDKWV